MLELVCQEQPAEGVSLFGDGGQGQPVSTHARRPYPQRAAVSVSPADFKPVAERIHRNHTIGQPAGAGCQGTRAHPDSRQEDAPLHERSDAASERTKQKGRVIQTRPSCFHRDTGLNAKSVQAGSPYIRRKTSVAFVPPNPNALDMAARMGRSLGTNGT